MAIPFPEQLDELAEFSGRHIGPSDDEIATMLHRLGASSLDELMTAITPAEIRPDSVQVPARPALSEHAMLRKLRSYAGMNGRSRSLLGMGYYGTLTPTVIQRNFLENPAWYTAYTPYQAEVSQGRLEVLVAFQQMIVDLTGMELANASLLDEATAAAEAMMMAWRIPRSQNQKRSGAPCLLVDQDTHPQTLAVLQTRGTPIGIEIVVGDPFADTAQFADYFAVLLSYPGSSGVVHPLQGVIERIHEAGAQAIVTTDPLALLLLPSPGAQGADIVIGSAQRFGVPMGFGGPHAAFMATRNEIKRTMPGRLIGLSRDHANRPAYRMALQTREQHIRRERATSNICTAQVLLAMMAALYAIWHGPDGLRRIALRVHHLAVLLATGLREMGFVLASDRFFDTLTVSCGQQADSIIAEARDKAGLLLRAGGDGQVGIALDESCSKETVAELLAVFQDHGTECRPSSLADLCAKAEDMLLDMMRSDTILASEVFHNHRSETEMMRWLRRLAQRDVALDRSMIPLGSCTMKLNAAAEMVALSWPEFTDLHPFVPKSEAAGYHCLFVDLQDMLCGLTGFASICLQPNSGAQGEYSGLLAIRRFHHARGENHRDVCLIPTSAHGTNPASAVMAGMRVIAVRCDGGGNVDLDDLRVRLDEHGDRLAALMITYPSTHGVFERTICEICDLVHDAGGLIYMDGANFNALAGIIRPADLGADVMHMNLHKTFCIPHGGGGPGMGPIGVVESLVPFLPGHPVIDPVSGEGSRGGGLVVVRFPQRLGARRRS